METADILREIADELHNLNINICELTNTLKSKETKETTPHIDDVSGLLTEITNIHEEQLEASKNIPPSQVEAENEYLKKQQNFDQALKRLGVL